MFLVFNLSTGIFTKLPTNVPTKINKIESGVKPTFSNAVLTTPIKQGQQQQTIR